jgi:hypothetical protein
MRTVTDARSRADDDVGIDKGVGPDLDIVGKTGGGIDESGRMNEGHESSFLDQRRSERGGSLSGATLV